MKTNVVKSYFAAITISLVVAVIFLVCIEKLLVV